MKRYRLKFIAPRWLPAEDYQPLLDYLLKPQKTWWQKMIDYFTQV